MTSQKLNRQRVNISVDPSTHERFAARAESERTTVSSVINDLMALYSPIKDGAEIDGPVIERLRERLLSGEWHRFQRIVNAIAEKVGLNSIAYEEDDAFSAPDIPPEKRWQWGGSIGKTEIGVMLAFKLSHEPDLMLGKALLFRASRRCHRVILVVPYRLAVEERVLRTAEQAGLEVVGVDSLEATLNAKTQKSSSGVPASAYSNTATAATPEAPDDDFKF